MKQLAWLGAVAALAGVLSLAWLAGAPSQVGPRLVPVAHPVAAASTAARSTAAPSPAAVVRCADLPGTPVRITVDGALAQNTPVEAHPLGEVDEGRLYRGSLYVPMDPTRASWLDYADTGPGADHGSAVLTSHVNYDHVLGALGDITAYRPGQRIAVTLADGRLLTYHVVPAATMGFATTATALEVTKRQLDVDARLNALVFDFHDSWSEDGGPACGRLVLVTCSGQVVDHDYQDNAFVFALPDRPAPAARRAPAALPAPAAR